MYFSSESGAERQVSIVVDFCRVNGAKRNFFSGGIDQRYEARISKPSQYVYSYDVLLAGECRGRCRFSGLGGGVHEGFRGEGERKGKWGSGEKKARQMQEKKGDIVEP
ncbi:hypothetical protein E3N88_45965 [Mikania micrantha]|uniref:Uncharacterized protein n=1 Tax=Mikania micrantha TaxID=192012 RepID=A0A5N6L9Z4_9ASTR|nr:hypothetical protein E3N88_45965 [Mikania micrantha]